LIVRRRLTLPPARRDVLVFLGLSALLPPLLLLLLTEFTSTKVMIVRYALSAAPAMALGTALLLRNTPVSVIRLGAIAVLCGLTVTGRGLGLHLRGFHQHNWRAAIEIADSYASADVPVLVAPWFVEAAMVPYPVSDETDYLRAPLIAYPLAHSEPILIPYTVNAANQPFVDSVIDQLKRKDKFALVTYPDTPIIQTLASRGFRPRGVYTQREPNVFLFENEAVATAGDE
jgi:hypothetical protein